MNYNFPKIRLSKKKLLIKTLVVLALTSLLISASVTFFPSVTAYSEPSLETILNDLGFINIDLVDTETFSLGAYNVTLMAEFAGCHEINQLSYYPIETSDFQTISTGPEGTTEDGDGYIVPPITKTVVIETQFGLSMQSPLHRYYTEHYLNPDYPMHHAKVYRNFDAPEMFLIGFENMFGESDRDFNDMVFSLFYICPLEIVSVSRSPVDPNYGQSVTISAFVSPGSAAIDSVILSYQVESGSWIDIPMSLDSGFYIADIPVQPYDTAVNYEVSANDTFGFSDVSMVYSYTVGDFVPPVISNILQVPESPKPNEAVTVSANVAEPAEASGVQKVTLRYTSDTVWFAVDMTLQCGLWTGTIPGQGADTTVNYLIEALDTAGNVGKTSTFSYLLTLPNSPPVADFSVSPSTVSTGGVMNFDASASYDPDGFINGYIWDFGDGTAGSGVTTSHSYADDGEYAVIITVVDDDGATASKIVSVVATNRPPVADIDSSTAMLDKKETVTFNAGGSYDPDGTIVSYVWNFGDGVTATGVSVSHSYSNIGSYTVTLIVTDDDGATDTDSTTKTVKNKSPVAIITETDEKIYSGDLIIFNAGESYDPDGTIVSYVWGFGDGSTATAIVTSHTYEDNNSYLVTLTVTDNDGETDSIEVTKIVLNSPPVAAFTETAGTVNTDETVSFDASESYDIDGTIVSYSWDFGDGTTATGVSVQHDYSQDETYTVSLTVTDDDGATGTTSSTITVLNSPPVASFTESAETVSTDESIHFDASESYDSDGSIVSYAWDFGDGTTATGVTADHAYADNRAYIVTLTVTDDDAATGSFTATKSVLNRPPTALFTDNATTVTQNEAIHFDASESYDSDGSIVSYAWDFGDGTTATGVTADHTYSEDGINTVTLTVTDNDGTSSSITAEKTVVTETAVPLAVLSVIGLGVTALTLTLLYGLFIRRRKKKENGSN
jgi:PKD repeat protein